MLAIWFLIPITFIKIAISLLHIFRTDGGAQSISTIPLATYSRGAAQNVIALFARMGLEQFVLGLLLVIVLFRYRAMILLSVLSCRCGETAMRIRHRLTLDKNREQSSAVNLRLHRSISNDNPSH